MEAKLNSDQAYTAAICSLRYAMGRMSYVTSDVAHLIRALWPALPAKARVVLMRDMDEAVAQDEIDRDGHNGNPVFAAHLGMDMDRMVWINLRNWMRDNA